MSPRRFSQHLANLFPVSARAALAALASLVLLLSPGPAPVAAVPVEEPQAAADSPAPAMIVVTMAATNTTTTIACLPGTCVIPDSPDPSVVGQSYEVFFLVAPSPYNGSSVDGTVTVDDGDGHTCSRTVDSSTPGWPYDTGWQWDCWLASTTAGPKTLTATFVPLDGQLFNGSSDTESHTVNPADTQTAVTFSPSPPRACETTYFTATVTAVSPGSGTPSSGTVTFYDGDVVLCTTGTSVGSGKWTCSTSSLTGGSHSITAVYGGNADYNGSTSPLVNVMVAKASSTTTVTTVPPISSTFGVSVTLRATVTGTCGTPTGIVFFNDGGVTIGTATLNPSGGVNSAVADLVAYDFTAGVHEISAVYDGSDAYEESMSGIYNHTVNKANTSTAINSSDTAPVFGQCVTFTATVAISETVLTPGAGTPTGIVTFQDVFTDTTGTPFVTTIGSGTLNGEGVAGFTTCSLAVGQHTIIATYEGDANFNQSQTSMTFTVNKATTTTGVVDAVRSPSVYGESVTFTAVVSATLPGAGTPTGKVVFKVDGTAKFTAMLGFTNPGEARWMTTPGDSTELDTAPLDRVRHITAEYSGDGNFKPSSSPTFNQTVNPADTTVQLQIPLDETEFGQDVRMTAIVSVDQPGAGTPTGTVTFTVDIPDPDIVMTGTLDGTSVTVVTNTIPVGTWDVRAAYGGDDHFNGDTSAAVSHKVNKTDSETSLESSANPSDFGQTITFTATVEPAGIGLFAPITPTGTVTFTLGTVAVVTRTLDGSGVATVVTDTLPADTHEITAEYGGDGNFKPSEDSLRQTVNTIATTTVLSSSHSPGNTSVINESVTFTATVTASTTPTGTVTFYDGVTVLDTKTLVAGVATLTKSDLSAGLHPIKAVYNGTENFQPSTSQRLYHTVGAVGSTTALTSSPASPTVFGQTLTFTATVTGSGGTPTGQVTFKDGAATIGSDALDASGEAILNKSDLSVGTHPIKAVYGGDADFAGSTSNVVTHEVTKTNTTTMITLDDPDPSVFGQPVVVNFTVTANPPGGGTPTGNVTVSDGTDGCTGSVASAGSCTLMFSTPGPRTLTATYAGDANFNSSSSSGESHDVDPADTTTTVTSSPNPSVTDQEVTITANVASEPDSTAIPTGGDVEFDFGDGSPTSSALLVNGTATVSHSYLSATGSPFTITATYLGDGTNFNPSPPGTTTHYVNVTPPDLSVTKTDSPDPVNVGDNLTYVINVTNNETDAVTVTLTDTLPPQVSFDSATGGCTHDGSALGGVVTCNLGSLAGGGSDSVTIIVNVPLTTPAGTVLRNTAQAGAHSDTEETTVYRSPRRGDCNGDYAVDLADVWAIVRDIFDPTFQGTTGCDANKDSRVDAGDVPSTVLIMLNSPDAGDLGGDLGTVEEGPALALPDQVPAVPGGLVTLPVSFAAHGHSITSLAFSVDYDETWLALDPTDRDGNGVPDTVIFSLPGDFTYSVSFDGDDADGEVDIFIGDISPPLTSLSDGPIAFMILNVGSSPGETQGAVRFSLDPAASFGDTSGQSVPGTATPTTRQYQIYLPVAFR